MQEVRGHIEKSLIKNSVALTRKQRSEFGLATPMAAFKRNNNHRRAGARRRASQRRRADGGAGERGTERTGEARGRQARAERGGGRGETASQKKFELPAGAGALHGGATGKLRRAEALVGGGDAAKEGTSCDEQTHQSERKRVCGYDTS